MYEVDELDVVQPLQRVPRPNPGAPLPHVIADETRVTLLYLLSRHDPNWEGSYGNLVTPESDELPIAIVNFEFPYAHMFGPPNDEAFEGHPLASRGLACYGVFE